ncbi:restriction endonuclease subunit S [Bacteroides thetaiotaomicron]|uniref:restriction endonuclease subunit S n=1 Tax=Bacteroides thetaiotaomicron TaxID=818 RepID=UPI00232B24D6|nr:restriction endonuclease subunit S [Bacteroides thetaiotaomicron]MDC2065386.1 restriction endonuclease subunit S [Bacteroides thetaiotaomicron]MDC2082037.1 restriction endonuclease subunit S [Bacteroides thetaiotaomicron]MDC2084259.1 restriction endonuclease subunit S [Bacteroides thetaiotaomicron]
MDTKALRQKILDLAIHGKLVPQDPNDEPASVLLERIKAEKERLIKEGKIKRSKKSAKTSDTPHYENVPFEVPDNWVWMTLGEVGTWQSGGTPSRSNKTYYGGNIPWLKTGDLNDGLISDIPESITEEAVANSSAKINPAGSVLIAMYGATIGKLGILTFPATTNQACCACIEFNAITQLYLFYFLLSQRNGFIAKGGGGAQPNISKEIIVNTFIPLPPLSEQQRIVMEIEKWFALIDQVEQGKADLQNTIKQTKSKILDLAIHGKLVPQDPNDEPAIKLLKRINPDFTPCDNGHSRKLPQGWYSVTANDVCSIIGGVSYNKADIQDTGIRVLRGGNIQNGKVIDCFDDVFISLSYQNNDNQVQRGDIIVVASTGSQTLIGKTGFADRDIPKTQIGAFLRIVRPKLKTLSPYIRLIFQTDAYKDYIRNVAKGSNINNVKNAHLQNFQICLPPLEEQQRIVQKIEELFSSLDDILTALEV